MKLKSRSMALIALLGGVVVALALLFFQSDPQGEESANCTQVERLSVQNASGVSASTHTTVCTALSTTLVTYVYVHPFGKKPADEDLVFRYSQSATVDAPKINWIDDWHVQVEASHVTTVSKMERKLGSVSIEYNIASH